MKAFSHLALALAVTGCATTPAELDTSGGTHASYHVDDNYQEVYRRIKTSAQSCFSNIISLTSTLEVAGDLYPDLGYGEVTNFTVNLGMHDYNWKARIEKDRDGAAVSTIVDTAFYEQGFTDLIRYWADGGTKCDADAG